MDSFFDLSSKMWSKIKNEFFKVRKSFTILKFLMQKKVFSNFDWETKSHPHCAPFTWISNWSLSSNSTGSTHTVTIDCQAIHVIHKMSMVGPANQAISNWILCLSTGKTPTFILSGSSYSSSIFSSSSYRLATEC